MIITNMLSNLTNLFSTNEVNLGKEPKNLFDKNRILHFVIQFTQLTCILFIVSFCKIEKNSGVTEYSYIILISFLIYSFVHIKFKYIVLLLTTFTIILKAFGILNGILFISAGLFIISICLLNIKHNLKFLFIILLFGAFAIGRIDLFNFPRIATIITYLLPLFMFRVFVFLYELKNGLKIKSIWQAINYFFLLPNIFFLFFPIIDYKTYQNTYYSDEEKHMWQKGIRWMMRGIFQVFIYRLISSYFLISQECVIDLSSLLQFMVSNYSLIIRISAIFHFIIGLLCMFGMNLPQTFDNYFLATSFVDLWRRINIYWRDFILKIFFYPIMFVYKKRIKKNLMAISMITVFFITFILHSYQLFWITGTFNLRFVDLYFWMIIGILITLNSIIIEKNALKHKPSNTKSALLIYFINTLKIYGIILFMSLMWSLWGSKTLTEWLYLMSFSSVVTYEETIKLFIIFLLLIVVGILLHYIFNLSFIKKLIQIKPSNTLFLTAPTLFSIVLLLNNNINYTSAINRVIQSVSNDLPNIIEKNNAEIGYYDRLIEGDEDIEIGISTKIFKKNLKKNPYNVAYYFSNGLLNRKMKPNLNIKGLDHDFMTNNFGIRDKNYSAVKPQKTYRFALLGGSYEMGSGVSNNQNFEYITEETINKHIVNSNYKSVEIWNFAAGGFYLIEHLELLSDEVFKYNPDAIIYFAHSGERSRIVQDLTSIFKRKVDLKYPFLKNIVSLTGIKPTMSNKEIKKLLNPYVDCLIQWAYIEMAKKCKQYHAKLIWTYLLTTENTVDEDEYGAIKKYAEQSGYITLTLDKMYDNFPRKAVQISDINTHPNVLGHQLIAKDFYKQLMLHRKEIFEK